jgi:hypothetical protein
MCNHDRATTVRSDTQTISIESGPGDLFDFLADPDNLPRWAVGFCRSIRREGDRWLVTTAQGDVGIRYATDRTLRVIDFYISPAPGVELAAYSRVVPNGEGAEYVFTQFQAEGMPDDVFASQAQALTDELHILQRLVRARAACSTSVA